MAILKMEERLIMKNIREKVYGFKTKHKEGFVRSEIDTLLKDYPNINMDKFNEALFGITCMMKDNEMVIYHCDVEKALHCGIENRGLRVCEWD
jgi:hypothetical protein